MDGLASQVNMHQPCQHTPTYQLHTPPAVEPRLQQAQGEHGEHPYKCYVSLFSNAACIHCTPLFHQAHDGEDVAVCDLTNEHLHNLGDIQLNPQLRALDLTANRLSSIDPRILALTGEKQGSQCWHWWLARTVNLKT